MAFAQVSRRLGGLGDHHLVDYGAGAGRVMILGAETWFGQVTGLEYSPHLVARARENLVRYGARPSVEILETDATTYLPPADADKFFSTTRSAPRFLPRPSTRSAALSQRPRATSTSCIFRCIARPKYRACNR